MYKFCYHITSNINKGQVKYNSIENSFDFMPAYNCDIDILMNYLNIAIESTTMEVKYIYGFSPRKKWIEHELKLPEFEKGKIFLKGDWLQPGMSYRYTEKDLYEFFDSNSNIYCIGDFEIEEGDTCIEFATNIIATITKNNEMKNIYVLLK